MEFKHKDDILSEMSLPSEYEEEWDNNLICYTTTLDGESQVKAWLGESRLFGTDTDEEEWESIKDNISQSREMILAAYDYDNEDEDDYNNFKPETSRIDWFEKDYSMRDIGMCECALIQGFDDLSAALILFDHEKYPQCIFSLSQTVEKSLKGIASLVNVPFHFYINNHNSVDILNEIIRYANHLDFVDELLRLKTLCAEFELIGDSSWSIKQSLAVRCRYFCYNQQNDYVCTSYPGVVYSKEMAKEALDYSKEIFDICDSIYESYYQLYCFDCFLDK
jgi:HEPN domain-containing protein